MRKLATTLIFILLLISANACSDTAEDILRNFCEQTNRTLPMDLGVAIFKSMDYDRDSNMIVLDYIVDESDISMDDVAATKNEQLEYMRSFLRNHENGGLLRAITDADASLKLFYRGDSTKTTIEYILPSEEIKELKTDEK